MPYIPRLTCTSGIIHFPLIARKHPVKTAPLPTHSRNHPAPLINEHLPTGCTALFMRTLYRCGFCARATYALQCASPYSSPFQAAASAKVASRDKRNRDYNSSANGVVDAHHRCQDQLVTKTTVKLVAKVQSNFSLAHANMAVQIPMILTRHHTCYTHMLQARNI
jgi:hypothetical protein